MNLQKLERILSLSSVVCYVIACALPAVYLSHASTGEVIIWRGYEALLMGILATALFINFAWLANPLSLLALLRLPFKRMRNSTAITVIAIALLIAAVWLAFTANEIVGSSVPLDEANVNKATVTALGAGFYFWLASLILLLITNLIEFLLATHNKNI